MTLLTGSHQSALPATTSGGSTPDRLSRGARRPRSLNSTTLAECQLGYGRRVSQALRTVAARDIGGRDPSVRYLTCASFFVFAVLAALSNTVGVIVALCVCAVVVLRESARPAVVAAIMAVSMLVTYQSKMVPTGSRTTILSGIILLTTIAVARSGKPGIFNAAGILALLSFVATTASLASGISNASLTATLGVALVPVAASTLGSIWDPVDSRLFSRVLINLALLQVVLGALTSPLNNEWVRSHISQSADQAGGVSVDNFSPNLILQGDYVRVPGSLGHPLPFALFLLVALLLLLTGATGYRRSTVAMLAPLLVVGILLSGSRTPIAAGIVAGCYLVLVPRDRRATSLLSRALVLVVAVISLIYYLRFAVDNAKQYSYGSLAQRLDAVDSFVDLLGRPFSNVVFGSGPGSTLLLRDTGIVDFSQNQFDNMYISAFAASGLFGLLVIVAAVALSMVRGASWALALRSRWGSCSYRSTSSVGCYSSSCFGC